ncbi:MAG: nucleotidyltransferase family protein [Desulfobacterales bacterium]|nr:nucleotidyltransferase family protein [Desulfobacterales bacterium]
MGIRPEAELLLRSTRAHLDLEETDRIGSLLQKELDWVYLKEMALRHGLMPILYQRLKSHAPNSIPRSILTQWRDHSLSSATRSLVMTEELLSLLELFKAEGIPTIPYKGPALAASLYKDLTIRPFNDLDILIKRKDIFKAKDLMTSLGYQSHFQLTPTQASAFLKSKYEFPLTHRNGWLTVELKWNLVEDFFSFPLDQEGLWKRLQHISIDGKEILTFSPEDLLIILCMHGTTHLWANLIWICDIAQLINVHKDLNWESVLRHAHTLRSERMLYLGLSLSARLLHASLPEEVNHRIEADSMVKKLAQEVMEHLFGRANGHPALWASALFHLRARECLKDKLLYSTRLAMTTTSEDWTFCCLPDPLFALYHLLRPIRLALKYGIQPLRGAFVRND